MPRRAAAPSASRAASSSTKEGVVTRRPSRWILWNSDRERTRRSRPKPCDERRRAALSWRRAASGGSEDRSRSVLLGMVLAPRGGAPWRISRSVGLVSRRRGSGPARGSREPPTMARARRAAAGQGAGGSASSLLVGGDREAPTTAATAVLQDLAPTLGALALAKAMGAKAARIAGLESTLHGAASIEVPSWRRDGWMTFDAAPESAACSRGDPVADECRGKSEG